ncbi:MAG: hypothetical protein LAO05_00790 [Acidobacteriia bacterium]|nr:hypothetical protein [Terriglobia bacterium]
MKRPNLAASPFLDVRPVWVTGGALAVVALTLTIVSLADLIAVRGREKSAAEALRQAQAKRAELVAQVQSRDRQLAAVAWKTLQLETGSLQVVVARRRLVWSQLLADLERVVPWDIRLVQITPKVDKTGAIQVDLEGLATGREAWLRLLAVLFTDSKFSDPLPRYEEAPSATNGKGYQFALTVRYWPEKRT